MQRAEAETRGRHVRIEPCDNALAGMAFRTVVLRRFSACMNFFVGVPSLGTACK
jgi:hypothetical protein